MSNKTILIILISLAVATGLFFIIYTIVKFDISGDQGKKDTDLQKIEDQTVDSETGMRLIPPGTHIYIEKELLEMADNKFADGNVPLGDQKYVTSGAKKGYVYLCNANKGDGGSKVNGPWIQGAAWNFLQKVTVDGNILWPESLFTNIVSGTYRVLTGNNLPIDHATGKFPVASTDDAYQYDPNPNKISAQSLKSQLPANPTYSSTPYCMGGEVGIMLSGVKLFNAFDAGLRDAPAHEVQDSCDGHPQGTGEYHYHSMSKCFKDINITNIIGFAYDGFPITGPMVSEGKYLTTEDLDECHGLVSEIMVDGKKKVTYHYVMTQDFPYSASCFRGNPVVFKPSSGGAPPPSETLEGPTSGGAPPPPQTGWGPGGPPPEAINTCKIKTKGAPCTFAGPSGTVSGSCELTSSGQLACMPK